VPLFSMTAASWVSRKPADLPSIVFEAFHHYYKCQV
jgi:hypothetical protein